MKTDPLVLAGTVLLFAFVPLVSHADKNDWSADSPLAIGEPMQDCDIHPHDAVVTLDVVTPLATGKLESILATPDMVLAVVPVAIPAVVAPAALPVKAPTNAARQAAPRHLSPATLLTFALIASPGTALPQTGGGRD